MSSIEKIINNTMNDFEEDSCVICRVQIDINAKRQLWSEVGEVGLQSLLTYSELRRDNDLHDYLLSKPVSVKVHSDCRKRYTSKRRLEQQLMTSESPDRVVPKKLLRSSIPLPFSWKDHCVLCGQETVFDPKNPKANISACRTIEVYGTLKDC